MQRLFSTDHPYFVFDPNGDGIAYFSTIEERNRFAAECIEQYLDYAWDEEVRNIVAGVVTHNVQQTNREDRPEELDEESCDGEGFYWEPDCECRCNYELLPVSPRPAVI